MFFRKLSDVISLLEHCTIEVKSFVFIKTPRIDHSESIRGSFLTLMSSYIYIFFYKFYFLSMFFLVNDIARLTGSFDYGCFLLPPVMYGVGLNPSSILKDTFSTFQKFALQLPVQSP